VEHVAVTIRLSVCCTLCALLAGCGSSAAPHPPRAGGSPRLTFGYDAALPLQYVNRGRINRRTEPIAIDDVSFRSERQRIEGYLLLPPSRARRPAVVFVHGSSGDRSELLERARWLAGRNVVTLTITEPSTSSPPARAAGGAAALLERIQAAQVRDVVAVRRAVDLLQSLPQVDPGRIGYLGWSAGAKIGTFVAASEPRVKALVLLSAGAAPIAAYVANTPPSLRRAVRRILGSVDPIRYIALARPGSILLEDGTKDEIVPHAALLNIVHAAPSGTTVRWYDAPHALDRAAYHDAFDWLARKLPIDGPAVSGVATKSSAG
jgi:dienelactone hydrolase